MANDEIITDIGQLYTFTRSGTVAGNQNWSETSFSSTTVTSGGGGYLHQGSGYVAAPGSHTTTTSRTSEQLRLFVRGDDEREFEARFSDPGFGVRDGHRVTIVYAGTQATQAGHPMALVNHSTGKSKVFTQRAEWLLKRPGPQTGCLLFGLLIVIAAFIPIVGFVLVPLIFGVFGARMWKRKRRNDQLAADIIAALEARVQESIEAERNPNNAT